MAARGWGLFFLYIYIENFKNLLVRNHLTDFNIILQKCSFGDPLPRLFKPFGFVKKHGSPSLWLKHVNPGFITSKQVRNNPTITAFVCFQKFPGTFKALCLLLLSEQMRYPPSATEMLCMKCQTLSQVQTLFSELFAHCLLICQYN